MATTLPTRMKYRQIPKPEHSSLPWHEARRHDEQGLIIFGASECPTLMGASRYNNIADLAISKWSPPQVTEPNEAMERGNYTEPALLNFAADKLGFAIHTPQIMYGYGRLIATLDGIDETGTVIVEAKTTTRYSSDDELPEEFFWQALAQLACVPTAEKVVFVVLDKKMRLTLAWEVHRRHHEDTMAHLLIRAEEIGRMLDRRELPDEVELSEKQVKTLYPLAAGEVELGRDGLFLIEQYAAARQARMEADDREQEARDALAARLADAEYGTIDGQRVISFKARKGALRVDTKSLEAEHPDLVAKYKKQSESTRVLRLMGDK